MILPSCHLNTSRSDIVFCRTLHFYTFQTSSHTFHDQQCDHNATSKCDQQIFQPGIRTFRHMISVICIPGFRLRKKFIAQICISLKCIQVFSITQIRQELIRYVIKTSIRDRSDPESRGRNMPVSCLHADQQRRGSRRDHESQQWGR